MTFHSVPARVPGSRASTVAAYVVCVSAAMSCGTAGATDNPRTWASVGIGAGEYRIAPSGPVLATGLSVTGRLERVTLSGRALYFLDSPFGKNASEFAVLGGSAFVIGSTVVHPAVGVATIRHRDDRLFGDRVSHADVGTAIGLAVFARDSPRLTLQGFANLNKTANVFGLMFAIQHTR